MGFLQEALNRRLNMPFSAVDFLGSIAVFSTFF